MVSAACGSGASDSLETRGWGPNPRAGSQGVWSLGVRCLACVVEVRVKVHLWHLGILVLAVLVVVRRLDKEKGGPASSGGRAWDF